MTTSTASRVATRDRLLEAGHRVVLSHGLRALTVREVAKLAKANLGSFVYHFGTRDAFVSTLIEEWYAPLFAGVSRAAEEDATVLRDQDITLRWQKEGIRHLHGPRGAPWGDNKAGVGG